MSSKPASPQTLDARRQGGLQGCSHLDLRGCGLQELPAEIQRLAASLEVLDVSSNALSQLPDWLAELPRLRIVFASSNRFTELPEVLGRCPELEMVGFKSNRIERVSGAALPARLRWLILTDNRIETLPAEIGRCARLQKLALAGNRLRELPTELQHCRSLELIRVSANELQALPELLLQLPRLSWLAFGGNPFNRELEQAALANTPLPTLPWPRLRLEAQLGEGASGVIHRALQIDTGELVAVKVFKGEVTSDGLPASEMAAALQAGAHPHLIPLRAKLSAHPNDAQGLVLDLISPAFHSLAGPPSLASCSRDVYTEDTRFSLSALLRIARGMASALAQLQARGLSHGDFYAHNILHNGQGQAYLGDFGAASFLPAEASAAQREAVARIEVRAFGCLLEELLARCEDASPQSLRTLLTLRDACLTEDAAQRPSWPSIIRSLESQAF
jgi:hypothetical protein